MTMSSNKIIVQNMVCPRCSESVEGTLNKLKINFDSVSIGEIKLSKKINPNLLIELEQNLNEKGFSILKDEKLIIVEKVKNLIHVKVANMTFSSEKFSVEISKNLSYNYSYVSRVFSANTGFTIEKYLLKCKIDKVKELIRYQKFSIKEIAYLLDYNSLSHLSNHFKRETGMTPTQFKKNISL